ncbi:MAG: hypothetical protein DCC49_13740, partial [Acidobacteria bacterium]
MVNGATFSADGSRIHFAQLQGGGKCKLAEMRSDGTEIQVFSTVFECNIRPAFSPDRPGVVIVFMSSGPDGPGVYSVHSSGGVTLVTPTMEAGGLTYADSRVAFMKDGHLRTVAVGADGKGTDPADLGRDTQGLEIDKDTLAVSTDGTTVTFAATKDGNLTIYQIAAIGGEVSEVINLGAASPNIDFYTVSGDGCVVSFVKPGSGGERAKTYILDVCDSSILPVVREINVDGWWFVPYSVGPRQMPWDFNDRIQCRHCPHAGDPVNLASESISYSSTDISQVTAGPQVRLTRTYNTRDPRPTEFGQGWRTNLSEHVAFSRSGVPTSMEGVTWIRSDGSTVFFRLTPTGYVPPPGQHEQLEVVGGLAQVTDLEGVVRHFDEVGRLVRVRDRFGLGYDLAYSTFGWAESITHSLGASIAMTYDNAGRLISASASDGRVATYSYSNNLLASVTKPGGVVESYSYDSDGRLHEIMDSSGRVIYRQSLSRGSIIEQADGRGNGYRFGYRSGQVPGSGSAIVTDTLGASIRSTWNEFGFETSRVDEVGATTVIEYNSLGDRTKVTDASGSTYRTSYNEGGDPTSSVDPNGNTSSFTWRADHQPLSSTDPTGVTTSYEYNASGALTSIQTQGGGTTLLFPNSDGTVSATISPDG